MLPPASATHLARLAFSGQRMCQGSHSLGARDMGNAPVTAFVPNPALQGSPQASVPAGPLSRSRSRNVTQITRLHSWAAVRVHRDILTNRCDLLPVSSRELESHNPDGFRGSKTGVLLDDLPLATLVLIYRRSVYCRRQASSMRGFRLFRPFFSAGHLRKNGPSDPRAQVADGFTENGRLLGRL
jgi:hypothetical protein